MYLTKKFALKRTRLHSDDTYDANGNKVKAYIEKGGVYYQMSNGTMGRGARSYNMSEQAMTNLINSTPTTWSNKPSNEANLDFCADDLPF